MTRPYLAGLAAMGLACVLGAPALADPKGPGELFRSPGLGGPRDGAVIVDHPPLNTGGGSSDTSYYYSYPPYLRWQRQADDITLGASAQVGAIRYWGFYNGDIVPDDEVMRVRFYGARASDGLPDDANILYEESFANPSRVATGRIILVDEGPAEYVYDVQLAQAVLLEANQFSWVEIVQVGDPDTIFRWEVSPPSDGSGYAYINPTTGDWRRTVWTADVAYQLIAVPEPAALGLFSCTLVLGVSRRSRKEVSGVGRKTRSSVVCG